MNKFVSILVLILILGGVGYYGYTKYEPKIKKEFVNISLSTQYDDELIKTGIEINGILYNTSVSYETFTLEKGINTFKNINIKDQNFYIEEQIINLTKNKRIDIKLSSPEYPKVKYSGNPISVEIYSNNFKDVDFCLDSSLSYLFVEPMKGSFNYVNLTYKEKNKKKESILIRESEYNKNKENYIYYAMEKVVVIEDYESIKLEGFENYGNCYYGDFSLNGNIQKLEINFLEFIEPSKSDYIKLTLIDKDGNFQTYQIR